MLGKIRASLAGDPNAQSPDKSSQPLRRPPSRDNGPNTQPQGPGFLASFLSPSNGTPASPARSPRASASIASSPPQERTGFFGGLLQPQSASPNPKPPSSAEASPQTIRASAAALLKLATPPLSSPNPNFTTPVPNDDDEDAQRDTLEHQINRRDQYVSRLQNDLQRMQTQLSQYQKDNGTLRRQQLESTHRHSIAVKLWRRTNDGLGARVECFENETTPAAAREIANLIRDAAPPNKDSAYLMMLQDQLTKANAKLEHLSSQTEIVLHKGEEVVESLREEMNEVIRERCRMELELLDQERVLEDDMRRMVLKTERRLKRVQGEIDFLEKSAVEVLKNQEGNESDSQATADDSEREGKENGESDKVEEEGGKGNDGEDDGEKDGAGSEGDNSDESGVKSKSKQEKEATAKAPPSKTNGERNDDENQSPEILRKELRRIAMDRDKSLSVLQKKLREKNDEFHELMRAKEERERSIEKLEREKRDREEWERSRRDGF